MMKKYLLCLTFFIVIVLTSIFSLQVQSATTPTPTRTRTPTPAIVSCLNATYTIDGTKDSYLEAERYTGLTSDFTKVLNSNRSGGAYMHTKNGAGSSSSTYLAFRLNVVNGGMFYVWLLGYGPDSSSDSFSISLDSGSLVTKSVPIGSWNPWQKVGYTFNLANGFHTLKIHEREDGTRIDKILLTKNSYSSISGLGGAALNCATTVTPTRTPTPRFTPTRTPTPGGKTPTPTRTLIKVTNLKGTYPRGQDTFNRYRYPHVIEKGIEKSFPQRLQIARPSNLDTTLTSKVMLIKFNPIIESEGSKRLTEVMNWNSPDTLTSRYIEDIRAASSGVINYQLAINLLIDDIPQKADGFDYNDEQYLDCARNLTNPEGHCYQPDMVDYVKIINDFDVCGRINRNEIDELWIFSAPYFGGLEWATTGPGPLPIDISGTSCSQQMFVMVFNYERGSAEMLEDQAHRLEVVMTNVYGGWNYGYRMTPDPNHVDTPWDRYTIRAGQSPYTTAPPALGNAHIGPNSPLLDLNDWVYDRENTAVINSVGPDFINYAFRTGTETSHNCLLWATGDPLQCSEYGFLLWWLGHIPKYEGKTNGVWNNWWRYVLPYPPYSSFIKNPIAVPNLNGVAVCGGVPSVELWWSSPSTSANLYRIERCNGQYCTDFREIATDTESPFIDTTVVSNSPYSYRVRGYDGTTIEFGSYSNIIYRNTTCATINSPTPTIINPTIPPAVPTCAPNLLNMNTAPTPLVALRPMTFSLSGTQGSTYYDDFILQTGMSCPNGYYDGSGRYKPELNWGTTSCTSLSPGTYTWVHTWRNCALGDCSIAGPECSKWKTIDVLDPSSFTCNSLIGQDHNYVNLVPGTTVYPGQTLNYFVVFTNTTPQTLNATIQSTLSPYLTLGPYRRECAYDSATRRLTCNVANVLAGQSMAYFLAQVYLSTTAPNGPLTTTATVSGGTGSSSCSASYNISQGNPTILLNSATNQSCDSKCASSNLKCVNVGTDSQGSNRNYKAYTCLDNLSGCAGVMIPRTQICGGFRTEWTYCRCQPKT